MSDTAASTKSLAAPSSLRDLLEPTPLDEFISSSWGQRFFRSVGKPGRYKALMPWPELARILSEHRFVYPQLRLVQSGKDIDPQRFFAADARQHFGIPSLSTRQLEWYLKSGATLIINGIEDCSPELRTLVDDLERMFHVRVQVNLYASWGRDVGLGLHWDDQDNLIVQVAGKKTWRVYEPTCYRPFRSSDAVPEPTGQPEWEGLVSDGDLLHIPWGWWHAVQSINQPSLHLTLTVKSRNCADLINWLFTKGSLVDVGRRRAPVLESADVQQQWMTELKTALAEPWHVGVIDHFRSYCDEGIEQKLLLDLPSVTSLPLQKRMISGLTNLHQEHPAPNGRGLLARVFTHMK